MLSIYNDNKLTFDSHVKKKNVKNLVGSYTHSR